MKNSLRALLAGTIDYAGLFPPASLSLGETVRNYLSYRTQPEAWMLARLVCPAARLYELPPLLSDAGDNVRVAALVRGGDSPEIFSEHLQSDLQAIGRSLETISMDVAEFRVPVSFLFSVGRKSVLELLALIDAGLQEKRPQATGYLELSDWTASTPLVEWQRVTKSFIESIAEHNQRRTDLHGQLGFKLRTGGAEAAAFPTTEQIAFAIVACRESGIYWKATAGLHQPLRHYDGALRTRMHGFLNVLVATVLADVCHLSPSEVQSILDEEQIDPFQFADESLRFNGWQASVDQIIASRAKSLVSFGSCSFDEPRQELQTLRLL